MSLSNLGIKTRLCEDSPLDHILKEGSMDGVLEMEDPQI